jgi:alpha-N-arabinofuranosidase
VFRLYLPFQEATLLPVTVSAAEYQHGELRLPRVDAIAARDARGKTWLAVSNLDPRRATEIALEVTGTAFKRARGETLTAPRVDSVNTFEAPRTVTPKAFSADTSGGKLKLSLAPASITVVGLE